MHVDVRLTPVAAIAAGTEILYPLVGARLLWRVTDVHADGIAARCEQSKDVLVFGAKQHVPMVVNKQAQPQQPSPQQYYEQLVRNAAQGSFGSTSSTTSNWGAYGGAHNTGTR